MTAPPRNPVTADQIRPGDPYEISEGRLVECLPTGRRGARGNLVGGAVLDTDPSVSSAGVDAGFSPRPDMLRAPDISVGNLSDEPGWASEAPPLAVEYADSGQDEDELQKKIRELLAAGTQWIWVVRLRGPRRVEVYEAPAPGETLAAATAAPPKSGSKQVRRIRWRPARVALPGEMLTAPGILKNPVPVEALYDRDAAHEVTLRNLLQRKGYDSLDAVRDEGRTEGRNEGRNEGRAEGLRSAVRDLCEALGIALPPDREAALEAMGLAEVEALRLRLKQERRWPLA